jgi:hypothetical protein
MQQTSQQKETEMLQLPKLLKDKTVPFIQEYQLEISAVMHQNSQNHYITKSLNPYISK